MFYNILVHANLQHIYILTDADEATHCSQYYCGSWCTDMLGIASLHDLKASWMNVQLGLIQ